MKKYYYINTVYQNFNRGDWTPQVAAINSDRHPIQWVHDLNKDNTSSQETILLSWQEITKEEYDLYEKLENEC